MLSWRLAVSAILIPAFIGICWLDHRAGASAPWLFSLVIVLAWRSAWEFADLLKTRSFEPSFLLIGAGSTAVLASAWYGHLTDGQSSLGLAALAFAVVVQASLLRGAIRYREPGRSMETVGCEIFGVAYIGLLLAVTAQLRWVAGQDAGYLLLASVVICAKCGDIGGYTLGRLFGKKKLVPTLSPGKTWMGGWGALLGSSLAGWAWLHFAPPYFGNGWSPCPAGWALLYGATIGIVGLIGDLAESLIKRDVQRKDSAALMPGFGGLLDVLDSILYAGPTAVLLWKVLPLSDAFVAAAN